MTGEVTAEVLEKVAKRLGYTFLRYDPNRKSVWRVGRLVDFDPVYFSDGGLLLAILNKAAETGYARETYRGGLVQTTVSHGFNHFRANHKSELVSTMLAFALLPESP